MSYPEFLWGKNGNPHSSPFFRGVMILTDRRCCRHCCQCHRRESLLKDVQPLLKLLISDAERHKHTQHVVVHASFNENETTLMSSSQYITGGMGIGFFGGAIFDQFHSNHTTESTHIAYDGELLLQLEEAISDGFAYFA